MFLYDENAHWLTLMETHIALKHNLSTGVLYLETTVTPNNY